MLENFNSEFTGFSERGSIIDAAQNGDTNNNNFHVDYTLDDATSEEASEHTEKFSLQRLRKFLKRKLASAKFKNIQVEMLYQRYLLRMNQNNAAHIVWLLFALIFILAAIHVRFLVSRLNELGNCGNATAVVSDGNLTTSFLDAYENFTLPSAYFEINSTLTDLQPAENCTDATQVFHELLGTNLVQFLLLGLCSVLYTILLLCLYKQRINEIYLFHVSYAIIISLVVIDVSFSITNMGK